MNTLVKNIGNNIKRFRQKNNWNQSVMALKLGISVPAYSKLEAGITDPNITRLTDLSRIFGLSIGDLLGIDDEVLVKREEIKLLREKLGIKDVEIAALQEKVINLYEESRGK